MFLILLADLKTLDLTLVKNLISTFKTITAGKYKRTLEPFKAITEEDVAKEQSELEEVLRLFKDFVSENRPSLDIDLVATGETWFGKAALEKGLCDEIRTVDDVFMDFVAKDYRVLDVSYGVTVTKRKNRLSDFLSSGRSRFGGLVSNAIRWLADRVVASVNEELNSDSGIQRKYLMKDDTSRFYKL